jgi:hypothetical protein
MTAQIVNQRKWFWMWQDEEQEAWLAEMSRQGLHLDSVGLIGTYRFVRGEPTDYVYRLDFQSSSKAALEDYVQLFGDAGWEHVGEMGGWHYFRTPAVAGESLEIFTDVESKIAKYQRVWFYALMFLGFEIAMFTALTDWDKPWIAIPFAFHVVFLVVFGVIVLKVSARIVQLRKAREQIDPIVD